MLNPGLYPGIERAEYNAIPAVNQSILREFRRTAAHVQAARDNPRPPSDSMQLGNLIHAAILEPAEFCNRFIVEPAELAAGIVRADGSDYENVRATKEYKTRRAKFGAENPRKEFVDAGEYAKCLAIMEAIAANTIATELLTAPGANELGLVWRDPDSGLWCKALLDRLTTFENSPMIVDVKTTDDARPAFWSKACHDYGYAFQAVFYLWGLNVLGQAASNFLQVIIETAAPYCVAVREIRRDWLESAAAELADFLSQYARCEAADYWPGFPDAIEIVDPPRYAMGGTI